MNLQWIKAMARKDIQAITSSVQLWLPVLVVPIVISLLLPLAFGLSLRYFDLQALGNTQMLVDTIAALPSGAAKEGILAWPVLEQQIFFFTAVYLLTPLFLLIPLMVSSIIAANSFASEKEGRTLESLLLTPIDLTSLFAGKVLSAFAPAVVVTLGCAVLYSTVFNWIASGWMGRFVLPQTNWLVLIVWVVPGLSLLAIFLNVAISAKVRGFQEAYQLGVVVVLPILGLFIGQFTGVLFLSTWFLLGLGALGFLGSYGALRALAGRFTRGSLFQSQVR